MLPLHQLSPLGPWTSRTRYATFSFEPLFRQSGSLYGQDHVTEGMGHHRFCVGIRPRAQLAMPTIQRCYMSRPMISLLRWASYLRRNPAAVPAAQLHRCSFRSKFYKEFWVLCLLRPGEASSHILRSNTPKLAPVQVRRVRLCRHTIFEAARACPITVTGVIQTASSISMGI